MAQHPERINRADRWFVFLPGLSAMQYGRERHAIGQPGRPFLERPGVNHTRRPTPALAVRTISAPHGRMGPNCAESPLEFALSLAFC
jgi:hypothetical protein